MTLLEGPSGELAGKMHSSWYINRCLTAIKWNRHKNGLDVSTSNNNNNVADEMSATSENNNKPLGAPSPCKMAVDPTTNRVKETSPNGGPQLLSPIANPDDLALLAKLEEANRELEANHKARQSLAIHSNTSKHSSAAHSRQGSVSSILSNTSNYSNVSTSQLGDDSNDPEDSWITWGKIVNDWESLWKRKQIHIKELVRKGVPHHFRGIVWQLLCNAHSSPSKEQYAEYLKMTSPCEKVIRRDITRTYPEHDFFKEKNGLGQESLFNVMKAYSLHDREVGYCQGSGFIVGLLLMQMPEEEAFAVLVKMMQEYKLRDLFKPSMAELGLCMFQLECMIQEHLAELYMHFQSQNMCVSMFASSWFLTLFTTGLPLPTACRIFDIFLSEGMEIIFRVGFAILLDNSDFLMCRDMEGMLKYLQKDIHSKYEQDSDNLLALAFTVKYNPRKMKKLEKEYNALKTKEQEDQVELRRLRTENRLLRQRIDNLEKETATLADRLIQGQVIGAQKEEEIFVLRRELSTLKTKDAEKAQKLDEVTQELTEVKRSNSVNSSSSVESQQEERIAVLQKELTQYKDRDHESMCTVHELQEKIRELESMNRQLQKDPNAEIQQLQEELIACKLREAEANLHMKELRQTVHDLERHWQKHLEKSNNPDTSSQKPSKSIQQKLQEDLMTVRLREAESVADLKEMKQKVMELETQNQICSRQIKRMDDERTKLRELLEDGETKEKELLSQIKDLERKSSDVESKIKEDVMLSRIKDAEHSQNVAEMRQRIAELEIENQELVTQGQLREKGGHQELENRIADLQEEILQLKMAKRLQSISSLALNHMALDTESDYDTDELESTITDAHRLRLMTSIGSEDAHKLKLIKDLDSSDGDGLNDHDDGTIKRKTSKKKRKCHGKSVEPSMLDKSPGDESTTLDTDSIEGVNGANLGTVFDKGSEIVLPENPESSAPTANGNLHLSTADTGLANGAVTTSSDTGSSG